MQMGVMEKILAPGVEHREEADLRAQMLGVGRDGAQRIADLPEQNVNLLLVLQAIVATGSGTVKTTWKYWV